MGLKTKELSGQGKNGGGSANAPQEGRGAGVKDHTLWDSNCTPACQRQHYGARKSITTGQGLGGRKTSGRSTEDVEDNDAVLYGCSGL